MSPRFSLKDFSDLQEIGRGGFGVVYSATNTRDNQRVAIKKLSNNVPKVRYINESNALHTLKHSNIVEFIGEFSENGEHYFVMELCELGSLRSYVREKGPLNDVTANYILRQLIVAVKYMHSMNTMHRDLSAGNILIKKIYPSDKGKGEKILVKICDFGLATTLRKGQTTCTIVGTPGYIAPQVYKEEYDQAADVFSLGGIVYTMLTGRDPPRTGTVSVHLLSRAAAELVEQMMDGDARRRITLEMVQQSAFYRDNALTSRDCSIDRRMTSGDRGFSERRQSVDRRERGGGGRSRSREYGATGADEFRRVERTRSRVSHEGGRGMGGGGSGQADTVSASARGGTRPRRAVSQPPRQLGQQSRESGFASANEEIRSSRLARSRPSASSVAVSPPPSQRFPDGCVWPLGLKRMGGQRMLCPGGRYACIDETKFVMESANKNGCVECIMTVTVIEQHQKVQFDRPRPSQLMPKQKEDPLAVSSGELLGSATNIDRLNSWQRDLYKRACNVLDKMKSSLPKIVYNRPEQFPQGTARVMEGGDCRLALPDGRAFNRKPGSTDIISFDGTRKELLVDEDLCRRFNDLFLFLRQVERVWTPLDRFPLVFSTSLDISTSTPRSRVSSSSTAFSAEPQRRPLMSRQSQYSAPPTLALTSSRHKQQQEMDSENRIPSKREEVLTLKRTPDGRFSVESSLGFHLRKSTSPGAGASDVYVFTHRDGKIERFKYKDNRYMDKVPLEARPLLEKLLSRTA